MSYNTMAKPIKSLPYKYSGRSGNRRMRLRIKGAVKSIARLFAIIRFVFLVSLLAIVVLFLNKRDEHRKKRPIPSAKYRLGHQAKIT